MNTKNLIGFVFFVFVWLTKLSGAEEDAPENWEVEELDVDAMDGFTRVPRSHSIYNGDLPDFVAMLGSRCFQLLLQELNNVAKMQDQ